MEKMRTTSRVIPYRSCPKRRKEITTTCCVITQKSAVFIYFAVEARTEKIGRADLVRNLKYYIEPRRRETFYQK
jgi:hypothetical protein